MKIDGVEIGDGVFFIAEAGINHNGDIQKAKELVRVASDSGADAVKFQTFSTERLVTESGQTADYQSDEEDSQYQLLKQYELSEEHHEELVRDCRRNDVTFLSTPFDEESLGLLDELGIQTVKLGSGELNNRPFIQMAAALSRPLVLSTGMGTMEEVEAALDWIRDVDPGLDVAFLHCVSAYPTAIQDVNLRAMQTMADRLAVPVGFSDHTTHVETPGFAVAAGASIVEKHFTLDSSLPGPDHGMSLEPRQLRRAVEVARNAASALGDPEKVPVPAEINNRPHVRKSLHVARDIEAGETLSRSDVSVLRPEGGLPPKELGNVIGRRVTVPLEKGSPLTEEHMDR